MTSRRGFLLGAGAALAMPAVVRAENLMKIASLRESVLDPGVYDATITGVTSRNGLLTIEMITREAVRLYKQNRFYLYAHAEQLLPRFSE